MIKGVLLDIDGTLILSNDAHTHAWVESLAQFGYQVDFAEVRPLIGMGGDKILPRLVRDLDSESELGKNIAKARREIMTNKYMPRLKPTPGAKELVEHMSEVGLKLMIASSAQREELEGLLKVIGIGGLGIEATTSNDVEQSKPDPDIVAQALGKLDMDPQFVLMLGDAPYDIEAAAAARVGVLAMRCGGFSDADLAGAVAIYDHPADLLDRYEESPLVG